VYLDCNDFDTNSETSDAGDTTSKKLGKEVFTMKTKSLSVNTNDKYRNAEKTVKVISTPYREGKHWAMYPRSFIPIIDQLKKLHSNDYVHGDIRAYNIIFNENEDKRQGWLIDFDFGGKCVGESLVTYPPRYMSALDDGQRIGKSYKIIQKWHDWYALGQLIFSKHTFEVPEDLKIDEHTELVMLKKKAQVIKKWTNMINSDLDDNDIEELKHFLKLYETAYGFTLLPRIIKESNEIVQHGSCKEATSSPISKNIGK
jgi:serine/threonine protein kinase